MQYLFKIALAFALTLLTHVTALAQVSYGLELGPAVTGLSTHGNSQCLNYSYGFAVPFGLFGDWQFSRHSSINAGIGYQPINASTNDRHSFQQPGTGEPFLTDCVSRLQLHYLSVPLRLQYAWPLNKELSLFGQAGPCLSLLLYAKQRDEGTGNVYSQDGSYLLSQYFHHTKDVTTDYQMWNFSLETNVGLKWQIGSEYGIIKLGRNHGLNRMEKQESTGDHRTDVYSLLVGYALIIQPKKR